MKKLLVILLIVCVVAFIAYRFLYKEHRDISTEDAAYTLKVAQLVQSFSANDSLANAKYADQTITVSGKVTDFDDQSNTITVDKKLSATLAQDNVSPAIGSDVTIKGRFVGYDDLLEELKMDQVTIN